MSVTAAEGFVAAGLHAGIKPDRRDTALLATADGRAVPTAAAGTGLPSSVTSRLISRRLPVLIPA